MRELAARRGIALAAAALILSGCFSYVPATPETVPEGKAVRVYLTRTGIAELSELPMEGRPIVRGTLVRRDPELVVVRVPVASRQEGFHTAQIGQDVRIPRSDIVQLERRQINRAGTALLVAGTAASAAAVVLIIMRGARGEEQIRNPQPPEMRVPLFAFPVR